ncbi:helix-turn-helix transcriptional regulator [Lachnospiraceae bacterium 46-61]
MDFKTRLKELRKERKITQAKLASKLNYGYTAIANYESGKNQPNISDLMKLANFLQVSVDYLIGNSNVRYKAEKDIWKEAIKKNLKRYDIFLDYSDMIFLEMLYYKTNEFMICKKLTVDSITADNIDEVLKKILENCLQSFSTSLFLLINNKPYYEISKKMIAKELSIM